jgi:hypothetical protein
MKIPQLLSVLIASFTVLFAFPAAGQLVGTEQVVNKQVYQGVFTVNGDKDTYYPVVFKNGNQNIINHLTIYRSYHEPGPNELHPTHKGGLLLEIDVNYGGWGGQRYGWEIANHREAYHPTFANASLGGGFQYRYNSDKPAYLQVAYSTAELIYEYPHPGYEHYNVYAHAPLTAVNTANINAHKDPLMSDIPPSHWQLSNGTLHNTTGSVAIGTTDTKGYKLAVGGQAVAEKSG